MHSSSYLDREYRLLEHFMQRHVEKIRRDKRRATITPQAPLHGKKNHRATRARQASLRHPSHQQLELPPHFRILL